MAKLTIVKIMAFETGTYNNMYHRPYESNVNVDLLNQYDEVTRGGRIINESSLQVLAPHIIAPSAQAESQIVIQNGWGQKRFRFIMVVQEDQGIGGALMHIMSGYTDHNDVVGMSETTINPQARLIFNTVVTVNVVQGYQSQDQTAQVQSRVVDSYHVIQRPIANTPSRGWGSSGVVSLRPEDVVDQMATDNYSTTGETISLCNGFATENMVRSSRMNNSSPDYLARTLNAIAYSAREYEQNASSSKGYGTMLDNAIGHLQERQLNNDQFMRDLLLRTAMRQEGSVAWGELQNIFPYINDPTITQFKRTDPAKKDLYMSTQGNTEYWTTSTMEVQIAARIAAAFPSAMVGMLIGRATINCSNMNVHNRMDSQCSVSALVPGVTIDLVTAAEHLKQRMYIDVLNSVTQNDRIPLSVQVRCDVLGDTFITVQFNCGRPIDFALPTFADHLFTPVLAQSRQALDGLANDFSKLADRQGSLQPQTNMQNGTFNVNAPQAPVQPIYQGQSAPSPVQPIYQGQAPSAPQSAPVAGQANQYGI